MRGQLHLCRRRAVRRARSGKPIFYTWYFTPDMIYFDISNFSDTTSNSNLIYTIMALYPAPICLINCVSVTCVPRTFCRHSALRAAISEGLRTAAATTRTSSATTRTGGHGVTTTTLTATSAPTTTAACEQNRFKFYSKWGKS